MIPLSWYLILGAFVFSCCLYASLVRRNVIVVMLGLYVTLIACELHVLASLCGFATDVAYEDRLRGLHKAGVGLWDVIGQCERRGSLDTAIVRSSEVANSVGDLLLAHRSIVAIPLNGGKAADAFRRHLQPTLPPGRALAMSALPSTSPAHAAMNVAALQEAWSVVVPFLTPPR